MKDLSGYKLVFFDDFDKGELDLDVWQSNDHPARNGAFSIRQASVKDSCLTLTGEYKDGESGTGWYGCSLQLKQLYTKGYFECRCKPSHAETGGQWSAFWMNPLHPYEPEISRGGLGGAELDVFECYTGVDGVEYFESTIHCAGMEKRLAPGKKLDSLTFVRFVPDNLCSEFHTFGFDWDDEAYTVYMDGVKLASTSWGDGISTVPTKVFLSMCIPFDRDYVGDTTHVSKFEIDWLKIWQKE